MLPEPETTEARYGEFALQTTEEKKNCVRKLSSTQKLKDTVKLFWLKKTYSTQLPGWVMLLWQLHEHVGQSTIVSL